MASEVRSKECVLYGSDILRCILPFLDSGGINACQQTSRKMYERVALLCLKELCVQYSRLFRLLNGPSKEGEKHFNIEKGKEGENALSLEVACRILRSPTWIEPGPFPFQAVLDRAFPAVAQQRRLVVQKREECDKQLEEVFFPPTEKFDLKRDSFFLQIFISSFQNGACLDAFFRSPHFPKAWNNFLFHLLNDRRIALFGNLVSFYPKALDGLSVEELRKVGNLMAQYHQEFQKLPFSFWKQLLNYSEILNVYSRISLDRDFLARTFLPILLGHIPSAMEEWKQVVSITLSAYEPAIWSIAIRALKRQKKGEHVQFLESNTGVRQMRALAAPQFFSIWNALTSFLRPDAPQEETSFQSHIESFLTEYPLLAKSIRLYPEEWEALLREAMDSRAIFVYRARGAKWCAEALQFLLEHPALMQKIASLNLLRFQTMASDISKYPSHFQDCENVKDFLVQLQRSMRGRFFGKEDLCFTREWAEIFLAEGGFILRHMLKPLEDSILVEQRDGWPDIFLVITSQMARFLRVSKIHLWAPEREDPPCKFFELLQAVAVLEWIC